MADIYLIVGKEFNCQRSLSWLNQQLSLCKIIADPIEKEKKRDTQYQYTPQNIRKISDPIGTQRFDYVRLRVDNHVHSMIIGRILAVGSSAAGISHQYWPASMTLDVVVDAMQSLQEHFPDAKVHAVYTDPEDVSNGGITALNPDKSLDPDELVTLSIVRDRGPLNLNDLYKALFPGSYPEMQREVITALNGLMNKGLVDYVNDRYEVHDFSK